MSWLDWLGIDMAVVGLVVIALEVILVLPRFLRLTKHLNELTLVYERNLRLARDELQILSRAAAETRALLQPYGRLQRWLAHPITLALFASYRRRLRLRRSESPAG
jgi:hypothetical protein